MTFLEGFIHFNLKIFTDRIKLESSHYKPHKILNLAWVTFFFFFFFDTGFISKRKKKSTYDLKFDGFSDQSLIMMLKKKIS